ncbi:MAG: hypothetical protein J5780_03235, partial [Treponema sp.]|nr:hypothetical protein [Treponema sp.]
MRKTVKVIAAAALFATASVFTVSAENESGLYKATASTVEDDVYDLNNVITWNRLKFDKYFGFTSIDSASEGNLALATHLNKKSVLGIEWRGNLWNDDSAAGSTSHNRFTGFYGWDNKAVRVSFYEATDETPTAEYNHKKDFTFSALFGMNLNKVMAFSAGLSYGIDSEEVDDDNYTDAKDFSINGAFYYTLKDEIDLKAKFFTRADIDFGWASGKMLGIEFDGDVVKKFTITPGLKVQYDISKEFTYAMYA